LRNTVIVVANVLNTDKQIAAIGALAEEYVWSHETEENKKRHITVLALHPVISAADAIHAAILRDYKNAKAEQA
jgi:hypothetical protein